MATWDSADLLARCKRDSGVPSTTEFPADTDWFAWMTEAQVEYYRIFASIVPWMLIEAPTIMSTADGGKTYTFASDITPLAVHIYETLNGRLLLPGAYWDSGADYHWEGNKIRMTRDQTRTFASGPYAQYVTAPSTISDSVEPTLVPADARQLLVYRTLVKWATRGGYRDPRPFQAMEDKIWVGNPAVGDHGLLGAYKKQNPFSGTEAHITNPSLWGFELLQTVHGYTAI